MSPPSLTNRKMAVQSRALHYSSSLSVHQYQLDKSSVTVNISVIYQQILGP